MADLHGNGRSVPESDVPTLVTEWLGPRRWCSSDRLPDGRRVAVVSSRLPRLMDPHGIWLQGMRAALDRLRDPEVVVVVGAGTATHEVLLRGAERQQARRIVIRCSDLAAPPVSAENQGLQTQWSSWADKSHIDLWPDPRASHDFRDAVPVSLSRTPERDRATIAWADEIIVLALRTGGNLHTLLRQRLQKPNAHVLLVAVAGLQSRRARAHLMGFGAESWEASAIPGVHESSSTNPGDELDARFRTSAVRGRIIPCPAADNWDYFTHSTRACPGPWPEQSRQDYVDSLLDGRADADHSPLGSLIRIVQQRRLIASALTIRSGFGVVSFTAVPLAELPQLRVFRSHRARWDFEPYGVCVRRQRLIEYGAQSVIYTGDSDWNRLSAEEKPFFQYVRRLDAQSDSPVHHPAGLDWSIEQEWRHVGDVDLSPLTSDEVILFVPTEVQARKLLEISPWPVTVLGMPSS